MDNHDYDMYGITAIPFVNAPQKLYANEHREAIKKKLNNFINFRGFCVLSGEPGIGKSALLRELTHNFHPKAFKTIYIPFAMFAETDILCAISHQLGLEKAMMKSHMIERIQERIKELQPINIVIIIDEIQKIKHETLELIRTLSNFDFDDKNYLSIIFSGTHDFLNLLKFKNNEHLKQRISCFLELQKLNRIETAEYIQHHLKNVGINHELFTAESINLIYDISDGIPRIINNFAKYAFAEAAINRSKVVDLEHVQLAIDNMSIKNKER